MDPGDPFRPGGLVVLCCRAHLELQAQRPASEGWEVVPESLEAPEGLNGKGSDEDPSALTCQDGSFHLHWPISPPPPRTRPGGGCFQVGELSIKLTPV